MGLFNWKKKDKTEERPLDSGLEKTKRSLSEKLSHAIAGKSVVDDEVLDSLEEVLIASDVGVETTQNIIERLEARVARDKYLNTEEVNRYLCEEIIALALALAMLLWRLKYETMLFSPAAHCRGRLYLLLFVSHVKLTSFPMSTISSCSAMSA